MNRRKLLLALTLAFALCLSLCAVAHAEEGQAIAVVPLNTPFTGSLEGYGEFRYVVNTSPTVVTVTVTTGTPVEVWDHYSDEYVNYVGKGSTHDYTFTNIMAAGSYSFSVTSLGGQPFNYTVAVSTQSLSVDERESNDWYSDWDDNGQHITNPNVLALTATPLKGAIFNANGDTDLDYYMITLDSPHMIDISVKQFDRALNWELCEPGSGQIGYGEVDQFSYVPLANPFTTTKRFSLSEGTYYFGVYSQFAHYSGRYEISAKLGSAITPNVVVRKSATVTEGFSLYGWGLYDTPTLSADASYDYTLSSDNAAVLAIDAQNPYRVNALKLGKATLTLKMQDKTYKIKVTVAKNEFNRKKPIKPAKSQVGIFTSLKKARYDANGNLIVDIFVYNKSGKVLRGIDRPLITASWGGTGADEEWNYYHIDGSAISFKKPIKNGAYGVYSLKITPEQFPMYKLDLRAGWLEVGIRDNASAKRITFVNGRAKGVVEVNAPMS